MSCFKSLSLRSPALPKAPTSLAVLLLGIMTHTPCRAATQALVRCYYRLPQSQQPEQDHFALAQVQPDKYHWLLNYLFNLEDNKLPLVGELEHVQSLGQVAFTTKNASSEFLEEICNDTIRRFLKAGEPFTFRTTRAQDQETQKVYHIHSIGNEFENLKETKAALLGGSSENSQETKENFIQKFISLTEDWMNSSEYQNALTDSFRTELARTTPRIRETLYPTIEVLMNSPYVDALTLRERAKDERVTEFTDKFKRKTDHQILAHQLQGANGSLRRGPFNTYIDLVLSSFKPAPNPNEEKSEHPGSDRLKFSFYDERNPCHVRASLLSDVFVRMTALKGFFGNIPNLAPEDINTDLEQIYQRNEKETVQNAFKALELLGSQIKDEQLLRRLNDLFEDLKMIQDWKFWRDDHE